MITTRAATVATPHAAATCLLRVRELDEGSGEVVCQSAGEDW
ncbi:hypothetical protein [Actinomadura harenae]|nr:hypothetical protein [Actinomadura harenae]